MQHLRAWGREDGLEIAPQAPLVFSRPYGATYKEDTSTRTSRILRERVFCLILRNFRPPGAAFPRTYLRDSLAALTPQDDKKVDDEPDSPLPRRSRMKSSPRPNTGTGTGSQP